MAKVEILMPAMGESVEEASIIKWLKDVGDTVTAEEPIVEIATDKVDSDIPSTVDGVLIEQRASEGDAITVGQVVAVVQTEGQDTPEPTNLTPSKEDTPAITPQEDFSQYAPPHDLDTKDYLPEHLISIKPELEAHSQTKLTNQHLSPLVKSIAKTEGVSDSELQQLVQQSPSGKVSKADILAYVKHKSQPQATPQAQTSAPQPKPVAVTPVSTPQAAPKAVAPKPTKAESKTPTPQPSTGDTVQPMGRVRKMIADNMSMSKKTSPHATSIIEIDMTRIVQWRERNKNKYLEQYGQKITYTPIIIHALAQALTEYPDINISVADDNIIYKKDINLGMAVAMESGDLIVPIIHNADRLNLHGLTAKINDLSMRARKNKLDPSEIKGGTYTMTNIGTFGNLIGTPIIPQPQVAIMAVGAIVKTPAVVETPEGDTIAIRHKMFASHTFDHRVVDGSLGGMFNFRVKQLLENFNEPDLN